MANDMGIIGVLKVVGNGSCRFLPLISMSVSWGIPCHMAACQITICVIL